MNTIYDKLRDLSIKHNALQKELDKCASETDKAAREFLAELQKIEGWECLIDFIPSRYKTRPNDFFKKCRVEHGDNYIEFIKDSVLGEYKVIRLYFNKSLKEQVQNKQP